MINQLALASLPVDFPAFVREPAAAGRIAFLAGEPDRWRNDSGLALRHANNPDHYLDMEQLGWAGLEPASVSPLRYEFALQFAAGRAAHADRFPRINPAKDAERVQQLAPFVAALKRLGPHPPKDAGARQRLEEFRWMVEEFKVSIFAQELGTVAPVSPQRLERLLQGLLLD